MKNSRCNIEETPEGVRICWGNHHRAEDCQWEEFVRKEKYDSDKRDYVLCECGHPICTHASTAPECWEPQCEQCPCNDPKPVRK